jgi:methenyltetrahydromethanopterin cyclohydrolase
LSTIGVNRRAAEIVQKMMGDCEALGLDVRQMENGTTVIDAGINVPGSLEAGRLFAEACMGGLGHVSFTQQVFKGRVTEDSFWLPAVAVIVSQPAIACMASQYAGWAVKLERYFAIGSGPARALFADEEIFKKIDYRDQSETAILMLEGKDLPGIEVASYVAERCGVRTEQLILLIAPTASLVGSVQIAARSAETGLHKLAELGFDVRCVSGAFGTCPLAPVAADDLHAIGRTNDAILYGSQVFYSVRAEDDELSALIEKIPSASSDDYGVPFYELFVRYKGDFYQIDRLLFSPAQVEINNLNSGSVFRAGQLNSTLIKTSLLA